MATGILLVTPLVGWLVTGALCYGCTQRAYCLEHVLLPALCPMNLDTRPHHGGGCRANRRRLEAARSGALPPTMPMQRIAVDGELKAYALGFMADDSSAYMIHVVREVESESDHGPAPSRHTAPRASRLTF